MTIEDRQRQRIHEDAKLSRFHDAEMQQLVESQSFTIPAFVEQAERLVALASDNPLPEIQRDGAKAQSILTFINRMQY